jgi:putative DNA primase/helicase
VNGHIEQILRELGPEPDVGTGDGMLPPPTAPMDVARVFVEKRYRHPATDELTLRHWRGGWWEWRASHWAEVERRVVAAAAYRFAEHAQYNTGDELKPWAPNRRKVADLLDALEAVVLLPESARQPSWLDGTDRDGPIVSVANGLLDVGRRELLAHTPAYFNAVAVPFDFDPAAPAAARWHNFLDELFGDEESKALLQEWFGYTISGDTGQHKILLVVGPTRAGKGVICHILSKLVGLENVAGPTLSSLAGEFGLAPLDGKSLAIVSDARLNGRGAQVVVERLLSISGEDALSINRKFRDQQTKKLSARIVICSNELPQLGDASMAIAGRFEPLLLDRSWYTARKTTR